jgi:plastocyanin
MRNRLSITLLGLALVAGCGGGGDSYGSGPTTGGNTSGTSTSVTVRNNVFDPSATTVTVGATVSWTWAVGAVSHTVTFDDGPTSPNQASGGYARVFDKAGTYPYHCVNHPGMTGTVTVK